MTIDAVKTRFRHQEESVYSRIGGFTLPEQSFVGTHTLYITNQGRIFAHDTGGLFGNERVEVYDAASLGVKTTFNKDVVSLVNESFQSRMSFSFSMPASEFIQLFSSTRKSIFKISTSPPVHCYVQDFLFLYKLREFRLEANTLKLDKWEIPFHRINQLSIDPNCMVHIGGSFRVENREVAEIKFFLPYIEHLKQIVEKYNNSPKIKDVIGDTGTLHPVALTGFINNAKQHNTSLTLVAEPHRIRLLDEGSLQVVEEFTVKDDAFFYSAESQQLLVVKQNRAFRVKLLDEITRTYVTKTYIKQDHAVVTNAGKLYGIWLGVNYEGESVDVLFSPTSLRLLLDKGMTLTDSISYSELEGIIDERKWFLLHRWEIGLLVFDSEEKRDKSTAGKRIPSKSMEETRVGFLANLQPFYFVHTEKELTLYQSPQLCLQRFLNADISDISVAGLSTDTGSPFVEIEIASDNRKHRISLAYDEVQGIIHKAYYYKKAALLPQTDPKQLFLSWGRVANDFALYHLFGQLITIEEGIKEISLKKQSVEIKNRNLVNFLYHSIQAQKKRMDQIAIYLPALFEQEDRKLLSTVGVSLDDRAYKQFQQQLIGITSQLKRTLYETESALLAVSFAIIPRVKMEQFINERTSKRYKAAAGVAVLGLFHPLALPVSIPAAGFMALNAYFAKGDMIKQEDIRHQNEMHRLDFYLLKALDSFDHLMKTLYPYFIAECNRAMYAFVQQVGASYKPVIEEPPIKQALFERLGQYYTFKQLPIDESVIVKKHDLIEKVHETVQLCGQNISLIKQEVDSHVSESTAFYK
ncbi:hypothetical protein GC093_31960 [Paenibacillus sp. LMG 31456]|uniref:Uncharacterized protein n=1 Tax=Paenibacillus foliorum TaxID=2654974 RepID=A0A972GVS0_9BACL|nr:hypothetical protein [Paenibacillus foliorum]NOU97811.1 hypothetical protein [Paenibacillus foliorum]